MSEPFKNRTLQSYLLAITDNYIVDFLVTAEIGQTLVNTILVSNVEKTALWSSE